MTLQNNLLFLTINKITKQADVMGGTEEFGLF